MAGEVALRLFFSNIYGEEKLCIGKRTDGMGQYDQIGKRGGSWRSDTHKDNLPMQNVILGGGFTYQGIIYIEDGTPRLAYEWLKE